MAIIVGISVICLEIPCHFLNLTNGNDLNSNINLCSLNTCFINEISCEGEK